MQHQVSHLSPPPPWTQASTLEGLRKAGRQRDGRESRPYISSPGPAGRMDGHVQPFPGGYKLRLQGWSQEKPAVYQLTTYL